MRVMKFLLGGCFLLLAGTSLALAPTTRVMAQQPTGAVPTVTGTPPGAMVSLNPFWPGIEQISVRAGPGMIYDTVGILVIGHKVPALGRESTGEWIKIAYPGAPEDTGWVSAVMVDLEGELPELDTPPTPTPRTTPTTDPTLAAQYIVDIPATRLPTFTPPDPLAIPTFPPETPVRGRSSLPMGLVIIGLGVVGIFGTLISLLRGR